MKSITIPVSVVILLASACSQNGPGGAVSPSGQESAAIEAPSAEHAGAFDQTLELQGITFHVTCPNDSSISEVTITPAGLEVDNSPITREVDGSVVGAEVADLDANGSPEVYIYLTSAGSGSDGSLVAYAANNRKSLTEIFMPPLEEDPDAGMGYMGHDQFSVLELRLGRRFPIYREGDTNAQPTGGTRQLTYRLEPGEAGWVLRLDERVDLDVPLPEAQ